MVALIEKIEMVKGIEPVIGVDAAASLLADLSNGGLTEFRARDLLARGVDEVRRQYMLVASDIESLITNARRESDHRVIDRYDMVDEDDNDLYGEDSE